MEIICRKTIYFKDSYNNNHFVANFTKGSEDGKIVYIIKYRDDVEMLEKFEGFHHISGCPYNVKKEFIYINRYPSFIEERVSIGEPINLEEMFGVLDSCWYDALEMLERTHGVSINDRFFVDKYEYNRIDGQLFESEFDHEIYH